MAPVLPFYLMLSGIMLTISLMSIILLFTKQDTHKETKIWVAITALLGSIHEYYFYTYYNSPSVGPMVDAAKVINITALWLLPFIVLMVTRLYRYYYSLSAIVCLFAIAAVFTYLELTTAYPVTFSAFPERAVSSTFWGQLLPSLDGPESPLVYVRNILLLACHLWITACMVKYIVHHADARSRFLIFYVVLTSLLFTHDALVLTHVINSVFISLLAILILICYFSIRLTFEHHSMQERLSVLALTDEVTGIPNRSWLAQYLRTEKEKRGCRYDFSFCIVDIDHFALFNRAFGHEVGNTLLQTIANRLKQTADAFDFVTARLEGDRFLVVSVTDKALENRCDYVAKNLHLIGNQTVTIGNRQLKPSLTVGVATVSSDDFEHTDDFFSIVEKVIERTKAVAKSAVTRLDATDLNHSKYELQLMRALQKAINEEKLVPYFQPQVRFCGTLCGAETLVRWWDEEKGYIPPGDFIAVAEKYGLISSVGRLMLEKSLQCIRPYHTYFLANNFHISANVSPWELARPDYVNEISALFEKYDISPRIFTLEITETAMMHNIDESQLKLTALKKLGFQIALDDFGTGYSSLSQLAKLPVDVLKIDKAFVDTISDDTDAKAMEKNTLFITGIYDIARSYSLLPLAEGVESAAQLSVLTQIGIEYFQGYYFAPPLPFKEFESTHLQGAGRKLSTVNK